MKKILLPTLFLVLFYILASYVFCSPMYALVNCSNPQSVCSHNTKPDNAGPGDKCIADDGNANYVYGSTTSCPSGQSHCVPTCTILPGQQAWCCDPKPGANPGTPGFASVTPPAPPPCAGNITKTGGCSAIDTALGTISTTPAGFVSRIFAIILSVSGGITLLLIIAGGYQLMTSQGNPEKVKEARERLTSAIIGLIFIIFSVTILQIIGITILKIPGFSQ